VTTFERLFQGTIEDAVAQRGPQAIVEAVGNWIPTLDDSLALQLLLETEPLIEAHASEQRRTGHWRAERIFIVRLLSPDISGELGAEDVTAAADAIERRALREDWQPDCYCAALMAVAARSAEWDQEYLGRALLTKIPSLSMYFHVRYNHAVQWLAVELDVNAGALAANAQDWSRALYSYAAAFANVLPLDISDIGMDCLQRLQEVITVAGPEYAELAIAVMSAIAPLAEKWLGQPLAGRWIVTYAPSLRLLPGRRDPVSGNAAGASVIGCSLSRGSPFGLAVVESAVKEAQDIAALYGTVPLLEEQATPESVLDVLSRSRRVHIAAHGRHNVMAPAFQNIYLSAGPGNDGRLFAHQILTRDLNALELVTMSSCETALGRFDIGDNVRGLPASLMIAGARALVGTLWPVQKDASRVFFTEFHRLLADGDQFPAKANRRLEAFAGAQRLTRTRFPAYRDWGPFYYLGDWS